MGQISQATLLSDARVQEEIARHRWLESEKAGSDIGFERAAQDWMARFSAEWLKYHSTGNPASTRGAMKVLREPLRSRRRKD